MTQKISTPRSVATIPQIQPGDPITARYLNNIANNVNEIINGPRDLDGGSQDGEASSVTLQEYGRTSTVVRITNPNDDEQFVDVSRPRTVLMRRSDTGETWELVFVNV